MQMNDRTAETLPLLTWRARPDMSCEYVNRGWLDYTGYTPEQALGEGWTRCVHPEDLPRWLDTAVAAFDERRPFEVEYRLRRRDGEYRWMLERAAPRHTAEGLFLGYAGACIDIDEHKREAQRLARALERERRARVATEEASRLRHQLMLCVLRELQPPTEAIATWSRYLGEEAIERAARAQGRIIASLLDLARSDADEPRHPLLSGVRVLVVDAGDGVVRPLQIAGAEVRVAASAAEALQALGAWQPDVVLAEKDEAFIRALRALPAERGGCLRAAALTREAAAPVAAGYDAQLAKPVEPVALLATVARLAA
jgi:PAS domain S-box-containing protein